MKHNRRKRRLMKIYAAQACVEDSLLQMRKCAACNPTLEQDKAFQWLYYLVALARQSP